MSLDSSASGIQIKALATSCSATTTEGMEEHVVDHVQKGHRDHRFRWICGLSMLRAWGGRQIGGQ